MVDNGAFPWWVYLMFILAGVLAGGTWSAYKSGSRVATGVLGLLTVGALGVAVLWMMGVMDV